MQIVNYYQKNWIKMSKYIFQNNKIFDIVY